MRVTAIIVAGGRGTRVGGDVPKQLRMVGGRTLLEHALAPFDRCSLIDDLIVVLPDRFSEVVNLNIPIRITANSRTMSGTEAKPTNGCSTWYFTISPNTTDANTMDENAKAR